MKFFLFFIFFILLSCSSKKSLDLNSDFDLFEKMTFNQFQLKLDEYSQNNNYPNIDK